MFEVPSTQKAEIPKESTFGKFFSGVFGLIGFLPIVTGKDIRWWALSISATFLLIAVIRPSLLSHLNRAWFFLGLVLHKVVSPLIIGILFFLVVCPIGFTMKIFSKNRMAVTKDKTRFSYWVKRPLAGPDPKSMNLQF